MGIGYKHKILNDKLVTEKYRIIDYNGSVFSTNSQSLIKDYDDLKSNKNTISTKKIFSKDSIDSPWPMYCHDVRNTGRSPYSTAGTDGTEKWRFDTIAECSGSPIIDDQGVIYIGSFYGLFSVYPNGTMKWNFWTDGVIVTAPAIDENSILYYGTIWDAYLYAIYSNNGTLKWKYKIGQTWASPTISEDGIIYVPATDNWNVHAFYPNSTKKWSFKADERVYSSPAIGEDRTIYCTSYAGYLYALHPENGTEKWKYKVGSHIRTSPCIADDGTIYTVSTDGPLFAFNPNGTIKWDTNVGGGTSPTIGQDGTIYCGYKDLYAINPVNGSIKWFFDLGRDRTIKDGIPCNSIDGTIYLGTYIGENKGGELIAINPDGTEKWRKMIASNWVMSAPAIGEDGTVYVGSWNDGTEPWAWGYLHAFGPVESNSPPETPTISGQVNCKIRKTCPYELLANDPDNNPISFYIDWGDGVTTGWTVDVASGEKCTYLHTWYKKGNFTIKVKTRDTFGEESDWGYFDVIVPRNMVYYNLLFLRFLERFSLLERILSLMR
jgi:outer membrane protein assembly factor BamB